MDKGDLVVADRVLNRQFTTIEQWNTDVEVASGNSLVEFEYDGDGGRYIPTKRYIKLSDALNA